MKCITQGDCLEKGESGRNLNCLKTRDALSAVSLPGLKSSAHFFFLIFFNTLTGK